MKRRVEEPEKPEDAGRWLLTYSDMITLMLALFIILYAISNVNEKKLEAIANSFHSNLNNTSTSQTVGGGGGTGSGAAAAVSSGKSSSSGTGNGSGNGKTASQALDEVYRVLQNYVTKNNLQNQIGLVNTSNYVQIHLKDVVMFEPNSPDMLQSSQPIMKEIEEAISNVYSYVDHITISGHTADVVVHSTQSDQISWKLSTDRAVTVLNSLIGYGLKQEKLSIQGYSHFLPIAPNDTEDGMAKNRRVEITIYKNPSSDNTQEKSAADSSASKGTDSEANSSVSSSTGAESGASDAASQAASSK